MILKRVCKQKEKLLQDKRLITGLMKPENTSHLPTHHAVVAEFDFRHQWQPLSLSLSVLLQWLWVFGVSMSLSPFLPGRRDGEGKYVNWVVLSLSLIPYIQISITHMHKYRWSSRLGKIFPCENGKYSKETWRGRMDYESATSDPGDYKM